MRIAHCADLHLGKTQYNLKEREDDYYKAAAYVFKRAKDLNADLIILAGDIFDALKPPAKAVRYLQGLINATGIEVVGVAGNHDCAGDDWLRVCGITELHGRIVERKGVRITGLNSLRPAVFYHELEQLKEPADIIVLHQAVAELANAPFAELSIVEMLPRLKNLGVKYVALGDIHDSKHMTVGGIDFAYCGSTEMTATDEAREKQFWVLDVKPADGVLDEMTVKMTAEPIPVRPVLEIDVRTQADLDALLVTVSKAPTSLVLAHYDSTIRDMESKLSDILRSREVLFITRPLVVEQKLIGQLNQEQRDRSGLLARQEDAVRAYFEPETDAYQLTCKILQAPENMDDIVKTYMKERGL